MGDEPHHECGFALLRLLKPFEYYEQKYGTRFFGLNRMYLLMEKQRNRGQDGCGVANVKFDVRPGTKYIHCEKSIERDPIKDVFERAQKSAAEKFKRAPPEARETRDMPGGSAQEFINSSWVRENVPFAGELFLAHVRYGTDSDNSIDRCHPVLRESNWMTRSLLLAGNFNITNNEDLFSSLVQIGQHPRELSDTVTILEKIGHFVDKENNDLYVKYSAMGQAPRTCFSVIAETINVARILRRASVDWDGGYCIAGLFGHGDAFCLRDPSGIRPAFYLADDEVIVVASEKPLIQTVFGASEDQVHPLPPGQALVVKRSGRWSLERVLPALPLKQCTFERIYFSRGNDASVYRERECLGRLLLQPLLQKLEAKGDSFANTVLSFIPNTSELAFNGLAKEAQEMMTRTRSELYEQLLHGGKSPSEQEETLRQIERLRVRTEKVVHKDAKIRTFIQEDASRESLTLHAYDVHYGTVRKGEDVLVALDDSIVRGNTLKNAILRTLDALGPKRILILSSAPQIRFPDVYGIDMAKLGDLAAFRAAVTLLHETGQEHILREVYVACRAQLSQPLTSGNFVNHMKRIYEPFTVEQISAKIAEQVTPPGCRASVEVLFNTVDALHQAMPDHAGDWYFTGNFPTPGGTKVCCRGFVLWSEGSSARCYGVTSALSCAKASILVIGHGGSDHALAWKLSQSHEVGCVYVAPGNGGTLGTQGGASDKDMAPLVPIDVPCTPPLFKEAKDFCRERSIALVVIGSEQVVFEGLADVLRTAGVSVFAPSQAAAEIDSSHAFSRAFAQRHGIHTVEEPPDEKALGEWPRNPEVSVLAVSDGVGFTMVPFAVQEHKRALHQDRGPMTDGMGAFAPSMMVDSDMLAQIEQEVIRPVLDGLQEENRPFVGFLRVELVLMPDGPKVLRFRCCIGDPVAQTALPLLDCDLFEVLSACATSRSSGSRLSARKGKVAVSIVIASGGYPGRYRCGHGISGLERALCVPGAHIFHMGTALQGPETAPEEDVPIGTPNSRANSHDATIRRQGSFSSFSSFSPPMRAQRLIACGGRVLTVTAVGSGLSEARERAYVSARAISFTDRWFRLDIAEWNLGSIERCPELKSPPEDSQKSAEFTYRDAGVDNSAREAAMVSFLPFMERTRLKSLNSSPVREDNARNISSLTKEGLNLISSTSTVGTKMMVASRVGKFHGVGIDLVAVCVNHIVAQGATPVFFQHHLSMSKLDVHYAKQLVEGIADGCIESGCLLLESGLAELPGVFSNHSFDLVGFAVGSVEPSALLPRTSDMESGDVLVALPSSGLHSNGFSLVRCITRAAGLDFSQAAPFDPTHSLGEALLPPARIYAKAVLALNKAGLLHGAAAVSVGGLARCFDGVMPPHLAAQVHSDAWELPAACRWLAAVGKIRSEELASTFNCGIGMLLVVAAEKVVQVLEHLREHREEPVVVGELVPRDAGAPPVLVSGAEANWLMLPQLGVSLPFPEVLSSLQDPWTVSRMRVLVLAGSEDVNPVQALVQATSPSASAAALVGIASSDPKCAALRLAKSANLKSIVLGDGRFSEQEFFIDGLDEPRDDRTGADSGGGPSMASEYSMELANLMESLQAELLVVLDDVDLALLTRSFISNHVGKVAVVHASLLPAFPGANPIFGALCGGVCITGCTVAFAVPPSLGADGNCFGPQIIQEPLRIAPDDNVTTLRSRLVAECESSIVPRAVQLICSGSVSLRQDDEATFSLGKSASFTEAPRVQ